MAVKEQLEKEARGRVLEQDSSQEEVDDHGYKEAERANEGSNASKFHVSVFSGFSVLLSL
jgi:hypothetical protein